MAKKWEFRFVNGFDKKDVDKMRRLLKDEFSRLLGDELNEKIFSVEHADTIVEAGRRLEVLVSFLEGSYYTLESCTAMERIINYLYDVFYNAEVCSCGNKEET